MEDRKDTTSSTEGIAAVGYNCIFKLVEAGY